MSTSKDDVARQFGRTAKAYATSAGHAHGSDLKLVLELLRDPTHIRSYTKRQWKSMLLKAGLKVVRVRDYRKTHDVADWIDRSDLSLEQRDKVWQAFASAPSWARKRFAITFDGARAVTYSDDKVIIRAIKDS